MGRHALRDRAFAIAALGGLLLGGTISARAAEVGGAAQFALGERYEHAEGMPRDYLRALRLYCNAARRGHPTAPFNIAWMYLNGRGVPRDDGIGAAWLRIAADRGDTQAARLLTRLTDVKPKVGRGCEPTRRDPMPVVAPKEIAATAARMSEQYGVDVKLILAVIAVESAFQVDAISNRNARGLMQLIPETAERFGVANVFEPAENIRGGTKYLKWLLARFDGDLTLVLAAYNAGETAVERYGGIPPYAETQGFVEKVRRRY